MDNQTLQIKQHKEMQANFLTLLENNKLADIAKSRYRLAQKAFDYTNKNGTQRYWQGYKDALQDVLQQAGLVHHLEK